MNSGFLSDTDVIAEMTSTFADVEVVSRGTSFFTARATRYGRRWILKGINPESADDVLARQQLLKEFEILSSLSHPDIVRFSGIEEVDGLGLCIIMEWIEGPTLEEALKQGIFSRNDRRRLMLEIVEAVAYLHSKGVVHRDLKPSNIMVRQNGLSAVIIDFGLADTDAFTVVKYPAGTKGYVSERQPQADTPDTSDDVYSLGVVMSSLYPEYGAIVRRCKSRLGKRYANASKLLQAFRRRSRLGRRIVYSSVAVAALCVIATLSYHNMGLRSSVDNLDGQLSELRKDSRQQDAAADQLREVSRQQNAAAEQLNDSVINLKRQLAVETQNRFDRERHDEHIAELKHQLKSQCWAIYAQYLKDRKAPGFAEESYGQNLVIPLREFRTSFIARHKGLSEQDRQDLEFAFRLYFDEIIKDYTNITNNERQ